LSTKPIKMRLLPFVMRVVGHTIKVWSASRDEELVAYSGTKIVIPPNPDAHIFCIVGVATREEIIRLNRALTSVFDFPRVIMFKHEDERGDVKREGEF